MIFIKLEHQILAAPRNAASIRNRSVRMQKNPSRLTTTAIDFYNLHHPGGPQTGSSDSFFMVLPLPV